MVTFNLLRIKKYVMEEEAAQFTLLGSEIKHSIHIILIKTFGFTYMSFYK
jgi:hypothetical protein